MRVQTGSRPASADLVGEQQDLKTVPLSEVEERLGCSPDGLTQAEAAKRLGQYGPNEIAE